MTEVELQIEAQIAEITLTRPEKLNAITSKMAAEIERICVEVDRNEAVRSVLVKGAGSRAFSAGSDFESLAAYSSSWEFRNRIEYATAFRNLRKPVIAALKGWVLGGGAEIALAADIRVADRSARIGFPEVTRGWVGGGGASQMLPRLVGYGQAMRLLLTGEPVGVTEALALGLIEEVVDDGQAEQRAREVCLRLATFSPVAVQSVKAAVRAALSAPLEAGLRYENELNALCFHAGEHREGIKAFLEKRAGARTNPDQETS